MKKLIGCIILLPLALVQFFLFILCIIGTLPFVLFWLVGHATYWRKNGKF